MTGEDGCSMETPTISIWPRSSHCVTDLFTKGDDTKHCEKTEHGLRCKLPRITHWLLKVTLKRRCFLLLSYWLFLLCVLSVTRVLFSHWPLDNLLQVCAHLVQEQRPPAMCFSISLNSGSIISSSSCSMPFPSPSFYPPFLTSLLSLLFFPLSFSPFSFYPPLRRLTFLLRPW